MVDDYPHAQGMVEHAEHYHGHVLCAGLGLGLIVHALHDRPEVERITVVEREPDVIALVKKYLPKGKTRVIQDDWYSDRVGRIKPDGVFYDLLVGKGIVLFPAAIREMVTMVDRFRTATAFRVHGFEFATFEKKLLEMRDTGVLVRSREMITGGVL